MRKRTEDENLHCLEHRNEIEWTKLDITQRKPYYCEHGIVTLNLWETIAQTPVIVVVNAHHLQGEVVLH